LLTVIIALSVLLRVAAALYLGEALGEVFNIGSTEEITILGLAERVIALTGSSSEIQFIPYTDAYAPGFEDMRRRVPAIDKITQLIG
jgi:UDP-glucose 4-epimerase